MNIKGYLMTCVKCGYKLDKNTKTCRSCGHDNSLTAKSEKRKKWFTVFLYCMIGITVFFIINNIVIIMTYDEAEGLAIGVIWFMGFKTVLYVIEVFIFILLFKMKKKILIIYMGFLIVSAMINFFTFDIIPLIFKYVPVYFVFQNQWHNFE
jgi:ribosomal protein L40E